MTEKTTAIDQIRERRDCLALLDEVDRAREALDAPVRFSSEQLWVRYNKLVCQTEEHDD